MDGLGLTPGGTAASATGGLGWHISRVLAGAAAGLDGPRRLLAPNAGRAVTGACLPIDCGHPASAL